MKVALSRTLSTKESLVGVFLALLIPLAAIGGMDYVGFAATVLR